MIKHLALIMDGNRRWAKKQNLLPWIGHKHGTESVQRVIEFCLEKQIPYLSLYTLSLENLRKRSEQEINFLFDLILDHSTKQLPELIKNGVRIIFCGDRAQFPINLVSAIEKLEESTKSQNKLTVNILFCYGGRQEIISATKQIVHEVIAGNLNINNITESNFESYLWVKAPDPDLIIRTGDQMRLSNFLTYQSAYSELYFTSKMWPDLTKEDLKSALEAFENRKRNFGQ